MTEVLLRIAACIVVLAAPFALAAILTGKAEGTLYLIFPMIAAIPAFLIMALVFVPIENLLISNGMATYKNWLVPLVGAIAAGILAVLFQKLLSGASKEATAAFSWASPQVWAMAAVFMGFGAVLGFVWRLSDWLATYFGWINKG